jgi:thioredoxin 1
MNKTEFQQKISQIEKPIVVDFWASWCAPCMTTKPILDKLGKEYADRVEFMPVNADESQEVLQQYRVFGIPTVITIRNGKEVGRITGARSEADYRSLFEALAEGREVKIPLSPFNRILRLGAGTLFIMIGVSTGNWLAAGIGGVIAFMGVYDRCPIWNALAGMFRRG